MNHLAADLFLSDLLSKRIIRSRMIRKMLEEKIIECTRELFYDISVLGKIVSDFRFSESEREKASQISKIKTDREKYIEKAHQCFVSGIRSLTESDPHYPPSFKNLTGMPLILYTRGEEKLLCEAGNSVAVVGSRNPSGYGLRATDEIVGELSRQNVNIISGLARGIDTAAHKAALKESKKTVAVTACGLDRVYPPENRDLFEEIAMEGLLISEMPPGQEAVRRYFPARNRIMSALSDVVAIIEAGEFSGTLHTASFAIAQGRDVYVLPGGIYSPFCKGNLMLLRDGAELLLNAQDILYSLSGAVFSREMDDIRSGLMQTRIRDKIISAPEKLSRNEISHLLVDELKGGDKTIDELVETTRIPFATIAPVMSELLLSGMVSERNERFTLTFPF